MRFRRGMAIVIAAFAVSLAMLSTVSAQQPLLREAPPAMEFFRFQAKYTVKATGEVIQFDLVRPCRSVTGRDMYGDRGWAPPIPIQWGSYFSQVKYFPKVTSDHHLIVVQIPNGCQVTRDGGVPIRTSNGLVPKDLQPSVIWYDDADDPSVGWLYATEDAFTSSFAKMTFGGAAIEAADATDFVEWQKQAIRDFRPSKVVKHPFGFNFAQMMGLAEVGDKERTWPIVLSCKGVVRLRLAGNAKTLASQSWPDSRPRFWTFAAADADGKQETSKKLNRLIFGPDWRQNIVEDGRPATQYTMYDNAVAPTMASGGFGHPEYRPPSIYPIIRTPFGLPFLKENADKPELFTEADLRPEMKGFLACFMDHGFQGLAQQIIPDWKAKVMSWHVDGERVAGQPLLPNIFSGIPDRFFERDEYYFTRLAD
jgi:hypothetical protein